MGELFIEFELLVLLGYLIVHFLLDPFIDVARSLLLGDFLWVNITDLWFLGGFFIGVELVEILLHPFAHHHELINVVLTCGFDPYLLALALLLEESGEALLTLEGGCFYCQITDYLAVFVFKTHPCAIKSSLGSIFFGLCDHLLQAIGNEQGLLGRRGLEAVQHEACGSCNLGVVRVAGLPEVF